MRYLIPHKLDQKGLTNHALPLVIVFVLCFGVIMTFRTVTSHAAGVSTDIKSGVSGYCLDLHNDSTSNNAVIDSWSCNGSAAQKWDIGIGLIKHGDNQCLAVADNGTTVGDKVVLDSCSHAAGQVWLRNQGGFENPNSGLCLSIPNSQTTQQLDISSCSYIGQPYEIWTSTTKPSCADETKGVKIACITEQEWIKWQSGTANHTALLNKYTDGASYEEWCADFVSYVYKEAGYPFTKGESNSWDENIASNIQNMGFVRHSKADYDPQPGDVAYFDYGGGHVEIVVSGGQTPTFIYGNSATIDPTTGNGQMKANTVTSKGVEGQVEYYLSPS